MAENEDLGIRIGRMAKALTKEQLAEMLAIHELDLWRRKTRTPTFGLFPDDPVYGPLIEGTMIAWRQTRKRCGFGHLTELGERVMLCRITYDLEASGALPAPPDGEGELGQ